MEKQLAAKRQMNSEIVKQTKISNVIDINKKEETA
jgi:hypothetical protein